MGKIKLGFIGHTWGLHAVGWLSRWLLAELDRSQFELHCWEVGPKRDDPLSRSFYQLAKFYGCQGLSSDAIATHMQKIGIDVLIDLDSITNSTSWYTCTKKPAPITISWLGWDWSGNTDYFMGDRLTCGDSADWYRNLIALDTYIAVRGFEVGIPPFRKTDLGIPADSPLLGVVQKSTKVLPATEYTDSVVRVMKENPHAYLLVKSPHTRYAAFWAKLCHESGVSPDRLRIVERSFSEEDSRAMLQVCDLILDSWPYNGCTTTLESLWSGTPVLSLTGRGFLGRQGYAFNKQCGIDGFEGVPLEAIATADQWVAVAGSLLLRPQILKSYRERLLDSRESSILWDVPRFARDVERAIAHVLNNQKTKELCNAS